MIRYGKAHLNANRENLIEYASTKSWHYRHEKEARLLLWDAAPEETGNRHIDQFGEYHDHVIYPLPVSRGLRYQVDLPTLIKEVLVSPFSEESRLEAVRGLVRDAGCSFPVRRSDLTTKAIIIPTVDDLDRYSYRAALASNDTAMADGLLAWLAGQPNVSASVKRSAGVKGDIDHFGALSFLQGLLVVLRDSGHAGLVLVLDEVETLQRVRGDVREKGLNALRQLIDEVDSGRFPGLYLMITGTPAFFDGPQGVQRLPPLAQRLHVDFSTDGRFDNPRAVQIRLATFDHAKLCEVGRKVRDIYTEHCNAAERVRARADDQYVESLASAVTGRLGGKVGIAPRVFLKKLVVDVLDRIDQFEEFDPRKHYALTIAEGELTAVERNAAAADNVDEIDLEV
jgi:hypothetical protein